LPGFIVNPIDRNVGRVFLLTPIVIPAKMGI
jgi:hypothetical protein